MRPAFPPGHPLAAYAYHYAPVHPAHPHLAAPHFPYARPYAPSPFPAAHAPLPPNPGAPPLVAAAHPDGPSPPQTGPPQRVNRTESSVLSPAVLPRTAADPAAASAVPHEPFGAPPATGARSGRRRSTDGARAGDGEDHGLFWGARSPAAGDRAAPRAGGTAPGGERRVRAQFWSDAEETARRERVARERLQESLREQVEERRVARERAEARAREEEAREDARIAREQAQLRAQFELAAAR